MKKKKFVENKVTMLDNNNVDQNWPSTLASLIKDLFSPTK